MIRLAQRNSGNAFRPAESNPNRASSTCIVLAQALDFATDYAEDTEWLLGTEGSERNGIFGVEARYGRTALSQKKPHFHWRDSVGTPSGSFRAVRAIRGNAFQPAAYRGFSYRPTSVVGGGSAP